MLLWTKEPFQQVHFMEEKGGKTLNEFNDITRPVTDLAIVHKIFG